MTEEELERLLPKAVEWVTMQESIICKRGLPLTPPQLTDARHLKIQHPEKIRILSHPSVPFPVSSDLQQAIVETGVLNNTVKSALFGYGIWLHSDYVDNRFLLVSEMYLLSQLEEMGGIEPFCRTYLQQCIKPGINLCQMEQQAKDMAEQICYPQDVVSS